MADIKPEDQFAQASQAPGSVEGGAEQAEARKPAADKPPRRAQGKRDGPGQDDPGQGGPGPGGATQGADGAPEVPEGVAWLVADEPLHIYDPEAGTAPVRAYSPGDRVAAEQVGRYGWHDQTHVPEWATAPPAPAPDDSEEQ